MLCLMQSNSSTKRGQGRDQAQNEEGQCCRYCIIIACTMYVGMCVHVCMYSYVSDTVADWQSKQMCIYQISTYVYYASAV